MIPRVRVINARNKNEERFAKKAIALLWDQCIENTKKMFRNWAEKVAYMELFGIEAKYSDHVDVIMKGAKLDDIDVVCVNVHEIKIINILEGFPRKYVTIWMEKGTSQLTEEERKLHKEYTELVKVREKIKETQGIMREIAGVLEKEKKLTMNKEV